MICCSFVLEIEFTKKVFFIWGERVFLIKRRGGLNSTANFPAGKEPPKYTPTRHGPWSFAPSNLSSHWSLPSHTDRWSPSNGSHQPKPMPPNAPDRSTALHTMKTQTHSSTRRREKPKEIECERWWRGRSGDHGAKVPNKVTTGRRSGGAHKKNPVSRFAKVVLVPIQIHSNDNY